MGDATWLPEGGQVDGALVFDGINDYVEAPTVLDPADSVFSVFAWIKGGAPGQVIVSQQGGANWLMADSSNGTLMTHLTCTPASGRDKPPLLSSYAIITDGDWHKVGVVWDGSYRSLYVDGELVATDADRLNDLAGSKGSLTVGAGADLDASSFFSGLIDDVKVYDIAVAF